MAYASSTVYLFTRLQKTFSNCEPKVVGSWKVADSLKVAGSWKLRFKILEFKYLCNQEGCSP